MHARARLHIYRFKCTYRFTKILWLKRENLPVALTKSHHHRIGDNFNNDVRDSEESGQRNIWICVCVRISLETILLRFFPISSLLPCVVCVFVIHRCSCTQMCLPFVIQCPFSNTIWYAIKLTIFFGIFVIINSLNVTQLDTYLLSCSMSHFLANLTTLPLDKCTFSKIPMTERTEYHIAVAYKCIKSEECWRKNRKRRKKLAKHERQNAWSTHRRML